jgi:hypothetical protein
LEDPANERNKISTRGVKQETDFLAIFCCYIFVIKIVRDIALTILRDGVLWLLSLPTNALSGICTYVLIFTGDQVAYHLSNTLLVFFAIISVVDLFDVYIPSRRAILCVCINKFELILSLSMSQLSQQPGL